MVLTDFIRESNEIEGIRRKPTMKEIGAHSVFMALSRVTVADLEEFVSEVAGAELREYSGMDVRVGSHFPPKGGPGVVNGLKIILADANHSVSSPWQTHMKYETLHPFMDGNGRSGRVLWAWMMKQNGLNPFSLSFLHRFYYQTLDALDGGR